MFEQLKSLLTDEYKTQLAHFEELKGKIESLEIEMESDHSEEEYKKALKELNKKYGIFRNSKKDYKNELHDLQVSYHEKLKEFEKKYKYYVELKREASSMNIYVIQKKLDQLNVANSLEDLKMTEEEATKIIEEKTK